MKPFSLKQWLVENEQGPYMKASTSMNEGGDLETDIYRILSKQIKSNSIAGFSGSGVGYLLKLMNDHILPNLSPEVLQQVYDEVKLLNSDEEDEESFSQLQQAAKDSTRGY
jgi:hypothetical protein